MAHFRGNQTMIFLCSEMRCVFILPCLIFMLIHNPLFCCYQKSILFRCKFDLLSSNSGLHEHGLWPTSLCILLYAHLPNFFSLCFFSKLTENLGLMQADDMELLLPSLLLQMDLKLFLLKVLPDCFTLHFIMFYSTGL